MSWEVVVLCVELWPVEFVTNEAFRPYLLKQFKCENFGQNAHFPLVFGVCDLSVTNSSEICVLSKSWMMSEQPHPFHQLYSTLYFLFLFPNIFPIRHTHSQLFHSLPSLNVYYIQIIQPKIIAYLGQTSNNYLYNTKIAPTLKTSSPITIIYNLYHFFQLFLIIHTYHHNLLSLIATISYRFYDW